MPDKFSGIASHLHNNEEGKRNDSIPKEAGYEDPKLMFNKVRGFVRNFDIYGQQITFNANKEGNSVNTTFGGVISIVIYFFMAFYITYLFEQMFTLSNNTIVRNIIDTASNNGERIVHSNETSILNFYKITK